MTDDFDWMAYAAGFVTAVVLALFIRWRRQRPATRPDLQIAPPAPMQLPPDVKAQALLLKVEGRAIEAIKLVRTRTGCDLKQAKDTVDALR